MRDEVIVITGCSSGIGLETALYLKDEFPNLYPTARSEKDVERLKALGLSKTLKLDVTKPDEIDFVINKVLKEQGQIDVWFNNAGYGQMGALEDIPTSALKEQFNTNVFALHECTKKLIPIMRKQGFGKIIQHSSVLGLVSLPLRGAYNASKYAVEGLSDTLRLELKGSGVYVILLNTGPVTSKFRENALKTLKNIDINSSIWSEIYNKAVQGEGKRVPFNLPAQAVAKLVYKIVLSPKPKPRYYITKATWILGFAKRLLSTSMLDKILLKV